MIGKPEWFQRRKYGGWGLTPKTWQGWVYIAAFILPLALFQSLPYWDDKTRFVVTFLWLTFLFVDIIDIMGRLKKDEREDKIEAIAERNAAYSMVGVLIIAVLYEVIQSAITQTFSIDPFIIITLFVGAIVKSVSNFVLERRGI